MKKRCTNSNCRKVFTLEATGGRCPHCGRIYAGITIPETYTQNIIAAPANFITEGQYCTVRTLTDVDSRNMKRKLVLNNYCIEFKKSYLAKAYSMGTYYFIDTICEDLYRMRNIDGRTASNILTVIKYALTCGKVSMALFYYYDAAGKKLYYEATKGIMNVNEWTEINGILWAKKMRYD